MLKLYICACFTIKLISLCILLNCLDPNLDPKDQPDRPNWPTDPTDRLTDRLIDRLTDRLTDRSDRPTELTSVSPDLTDRLHSFALCKVFLRLIFERIFSLVSLVAICSRVSGHLQNKCIFDREEQTARVAQCKLHLASSDSALLGDWSSVEFDFGSWGRPQVFVTAPPSR